MATEYKAVAGSRLTDDDARVIGAEVEKLGQHTTAEQLLAAASSKRSPLHRFFTWDDTEAARQYRLDEARYLLRSVKVTIVSSAWGGPTSTRAFVTVEKPSDGRVYANVVSVLSDAEYRAQLLRKALADFQTWQDKYQVLEELAEIFAAGERELAKARARKKSA